MPTWLREPARQRRSHQWRTWSTILMWQLLPGMDCWWCSGTIAASKECIIVPHQVLDGLLTAIHLQLNHPTRHQLKAVVNRYFFALDMATAIDRVTEACHQCLSLRKVPQLVVPQSSSCPPEAIGTSFAADVIKGNKQLIFVLREVVTSFTGTCLLQNEQHQTLRDALLQLCISLKPLDDPPDVVRVDPAPGFQSIWDDELLGRHGIQIELGSAKNPNKNPVAEKAVQELEAKVLCLNPSGGPTNPVQLAVATALLNTRIRGGGLSSREMWTQSIHRPTTPNGWSGVDTQPTRVSHIQPSL